MGEARSILFYLADKYQDDDDDSLSCGWLPVAREARSKVLSALFFDQSSFFQSMNDAVVRWRENLSHKS